jgi:hypothetical protein
LKRSAEVSAVLRLKGTDVVDEVHLQRGRGSGGLEGLVAWWVGWVRRRRSLCVGLLQRSHDVCAAVLQLLVL